MNTQLRTKIITVGKTVIENFNYQKATKTETKPYCVFDFFSFTSEKTTKDEMEKYFFQIRMVAVTDAEVETLADSLKTAFELADMELTDYYHLGTKQINKRPLPIDNITDFRGLIIEIETWLEIK